MSGESGRLLRAAAASTDELARELELRLESCFGADALGSKKREPLLDREGA